MKTKKVSIRDTAILKKNPDMVSREIEDETILLPIYKSSDEIDCIYTLNKAGSVFWELVNERRTLGEIKKALLNKFSSTPDEVNKETAKFLKELKKIKAIK